MKPLPQFRLATCGSASGPGRVTLAAGAHGTPAADGVRPGRAVALLGALLVAGVTTAYWQSLDTPFHFDDVPAVSDNPTLRHLADLRQVLSPPSNYGTTVNGRPLLNVTLALNYAIGGTSVRGFHVVNLAIHAAATLLLYGIVRRTLNSVSVPRATIVAAVAAGVWSLHPLLTESVTYVIQRAESLAACWTLLALYAFIRGASSARPGFWYALSVAGSAAGMATKETACVTPMLVLLHDRTFVAGSWRRAWRARRRYYVALAGTWVLLAAMVAMSHGRGGTAGFDAGIAWWRYALTQSVAVFHYLRLALWPVPLVFDYGFVAVFGAEVVGCCALGIAVLLGVTGWWLRTRSPLGYCAACFFLTLAPSSSIVPVATQIMAEHRLYLPLAALVAAVVGAGAAYLGGRLIPAALAVALACGAHTQARNRVYRSELALWRNTVAAVPGNARAQNNLGRAEVEAGDVDAALRCFAIALHLSPDYPETQNNLGYALARKGRMAEAVTHYEASLRLRPTNVHAHDNLGNALLQLGRVDDAFREFHAALAVKPDAADAHWGLGNALVAKGDLDEALVQYRIAAHLDPAFADAHYGMAVVLEKLGRHEDAIAGYREALRLKPRFPEAHNNLGNTLVATGRFAPALVEYEQALRLDPRDPQARTNLANALLATGKTAAAIEAYEYVLRDRPGEVDAEFGLGNALVQAGRLPAALAAFRAVVAAHPDHVAARVNLAGVLLVTGAPAEATVQYEAAARLRPDDPELKQMLEYARQSAQDGRQP